MDGQVTARQRHSKILFLFLLLGSCPLSIFGFWIEVSLYLTHRNDNISQTTFFAANEAQLLSITTPQDNPNSANKILQTANAMLASSLVLHSFSGM
jgi:hypothetical protein